MSTDPSENSQIGDQKESPIPALREELENLIDSEARQRFEEYVSARSTEPPYCWPASTSDAASDPINPVIDLCCKICGMAARSGPFLFPDPDKDKIKEIKKKTRYIKAQLTTSLNYLKRARAMNVYYSSSDPGEPGPITSQDIDLIEKVFDRAWRWHKHAWALDTLHLPFPEKRTTPGRPALDHVNALEWELWQLLKCTGMKRRRASHHIEKLLGFYDLSEREWDSIEQRLIQQDKSSQS